MVGLKPRKEVHKASKIWKEICYRNLSVQKLKLGVLLQTKTKKTVSRQNQTRKKMINQFIHSECFYDSNYWTSTRFFWSMTTCMALVPMSEVSQTLESSSLLSFFRQENICMIHWTEDLRCPKSIWSWYKRIFTSSKPQISRWNILIVNL